MKVSSGTVQRPAKTSVQQKTKMLRPSALSTQGDKEVYCVLVRNELVKKMF